MTAIAQERDAYGNPIGVMTLGANQSVAYTGTAGTVSNVLGTNMVRVLCTTDAFIKIGASPTALATDVFILANTVEYFGCDAADKVSAIQSSTGGTLYVTAGA